MARGLHDVSGQVGTRSDTFNDGRSWLTFFDQGDRVLRDPDLQRARYERIAQDLERLIPLHPGLQMLDYGCGDALAASRYLARGVRLALYDRSPRIMEQLRHRFAGAADVRALSSKEYEEIPPDQFDVILVHSVIQYISSPQLPGLLRRWHTLLKPGGTLVVSDILTRSTSGWADAFSLLRFGLSQGMTRSVLQDLMHVLNSRYHALHRTVGLTRYDVIELKESLARAGFDVQRLPVNPGPLRGRCAYRAIKPPE